MSDLRIKRYRKRIEKLETENEKLRLLLKKYNEKGLPKLVDETLKMKKEYEELINENLEIKSEYEKLVEEQKKINEEYKDALNEVIKII